MSYADGYFQSVLVVFNQHFVKAILALRLIPGFASTRCLCNLN